MASDKTRAVLGVAKLALALAVGYAFYWIWGENRPGLDEWWVAIAAGIVAAVMVFVLLSKLNKGGGD